MHQVTMHDVAFKPARGVAPTPPDKSNAGPAQCRPPVDTPAAEAHEGLGKMGVGRLSGSRGDGP